MTNVIFFGSPTFAIHSLQAIAHDKRFHIGAVITQPDKPRGRTMKLHPTPTAIAAEQLGIPVIKLANADERNAAILNIGQFDVFVVVAYGALLPPSLLALPVHGSINLHPSLLPRYRGSSPIQQAILKGDTETGVSVMLLDEEMDHGPLLAQESISLNVLDNADTLSKRLSVTGARLLIETIPRYLQGEILPRSQNHAHATLTRQISKEDGRIDWTKTADEISRMVRAYSSWPGAWTKFEHNGNTYTIKIKKSSPIEPKNVGNEIKMRYGMIVPEERGTHDAIIHCGGGTFLHLEIVQPAGSTEMSGEAFLNGHNTIREFV